MIFTKMPKNLLKKKKGSIKMYKVCKYCGKTFKTSKQSRVCCSRKCSSLLRFEPNNYVFYKDYTEMIVNTKGKELRVKISLCDVEKIKHIRWFARFDGHNFYFDGWNRETKKIEKLHNYIMDCPKGMVVDHLNTYDHLDNRRENLKICTQFENIQNQKQRKNSSGYQYVKWHKQSKKWEFTFKNITLIRSKNLDKVISFRNEYLKKEKKNEIA